MIQTKSNKHKLFQKSLSSFSAESTAVSEKKVMNLLKDTPISSPSPPAEMAMRWAVCHFDVTPRDNTYTIIFHRKEYFKLHHIAGATIQVANIVNYD